MKSWATQKTRHFESQMLKQKGAFDIKAYMRKLENTNDEISKTWDSLIIRRNELEKETQREFDKIRNEELKHLEELREPILKEMKALDKQVIFLRSQHDAILNESENRLNIIFKERAKKLDDVVIKMNFCYDKYVCCIAKRFEEENVPR